MAPNANQLAGALLEEAVLSVLASAGFRALDSTLGDDTIVPDGARFTLRGRGTTHQIDAIADPLVGYAFSNPARLLVEAKSYSAQNRVGLSIVRNAVGTVKDLSEFWRPPGEGLAGARRYHYRYAIFASTEFTAPAQEYAYAQDVYLLPLRRSAFFRPIIDAIDALRPRGDGSGADVAGYRAALRGALRGNPLADDFSDLDTLAHAVREVRDGLLAVADRGFPIFLVPSSPSVIDGLHDVERVRIHYDDNGWYIRRSESDENLFSFDLPEELFSLYAKGSILEPDRAIDLKAERLAVLQAVVVKGKRVRVIQFELDTEWISALLRRRLR